MQEPDVDVHHADGVCVCRMAMGGCELSVCQCTVPAARSVQAVWSVQPLGQWQLSVALCAKRVSWWVTSHQNLLRHKLKKRFLDFLSRALAEFWL